jgi:cytidylate kinase
MKQVNLPKFAARDRVQRSDEENAWFSRYFFQVDWSERSRYDLILDTSTVSPQEAARRLVKAIGQRPAADPVSSARPVGHTTRQES